MSKFDFAMLGAVTIILSVLLSGTMRPDARALPDAALAAQVAAIEARMDQMERDLSEQLAELHRTVEQLSGTVIHKPAVAMNDAEALEEVRRLTYGSGNPTEVN